MIYFLFNFQNFLSSRKNHALMDAPFVRNSAAKNFSYEFGWPIADNIENSPWKSTSEKPFD